MNAQRDRLGEWGPPPSGTVVKEYFPKQHSIPFRSYNCNGSGHLSKDCPNERAEKTCYNCKQTGHMVNFHFISEYQLFAYEIDLHILVLNSPETALSLVKPAAVVTAAVLLATT